MPSHSPPRFEPAPQPPPASTLPAGYIPPSPPPRAQLVSLLGSDICVAPSAALVDIANATSRSLTVQESLAYYTTCGGAAPPLAPAGA